MHTYNSRKDWGLFVICVGAFGLAWWIGYVQPRTEYLTAVRDRVTQGRTR